MLSAVLKAMRDRSAHGHGQLLHTVHATATERAAIEAALRCGFRHGPDRCVPDAPRGLDKARSWGAALMWYGSRVFHDDPTSQARWSTIFEQLELVPRGLSEAEYDAMQDGMARVWGGRLLRSAHTPPRRLFRSTMLYHSGALWELLVAVMTALNDGDWRNLASGDDDSAVTLLRALPLGAEAERLQSETIAYAVAAFVEELAVFRALTDERGWPVGDADALVTATRSEGLDPAALCGGLNPERLGLILRLLFGSRPGKALTPSVGLRWRWRIGQVCGLELALPEAIPAAALGVSAHRIQLRLDGQRRGAKYRLEQGRYRLEQGSPRALGYDLSGAPSLVLDVPLGRGQRDILAVEAPALPRPVALFDERGALLASPSIGRPVILVVPEGHQVRGLPDDFRRQPTAGGVQAWKGAAPASAIHFEIETPDGERQRWTLDSLSAIRTDARLVDPVPGLRLAGLPAARRWPAIFLPPDVRDVQLVHQPDSGLERECAAAIGVGAAGFLRVSPRPTAPGRYAVRYHSHGAEAALRFVLLPAGSQFVTLPQDRGQCLMEAGPGWVIAEGGQEHREAAQVDCESPRQLALEVRHPDGGLSGAWRARAVSRRWLLLDPERGDQPVARDGSDRVMAGAVVLRVYGLPGTTCTLGCRFDEDAAPALEATRHFPEAGVVDFPLSWIERTHWTRRVRLQLRWGGDSGWTPVADYSDYDKVAPTLLRHPSPSGVALEVLHPVDQEELELRFLLPDADLSAHAHGLTLRRSGHCGAAKRYCGDAPPEGARLVLTADGLPVSAPTGPSGYDSRRLRGLLRPTRGWASGDGPTPQSAFATLAMVLTNARHFGLSLCAPEVAPLIAWWRLCHLVHQPDAPVLGMLEQAMERDGIPKSLVRYGHVRALFPAPVGAYTPEDQREIDRIRKALSGSGHGLRAVATLLGTPRALIASSQSFRGKPCSLRQAALAGLGRSHVPAPPVPPDARRRELCMRGVPEPDMERAVHLEKLTRIRPLQRMEAAANRGRRLDATETFLLRVSYLAHRFRRGQKMNGWFPRMARDLCWAEDNAAAALDLWLDAWTHPDELEP